MKLLNFAFYSQANKSLSLYMLRKITSEDERQKKNVISKAKIVALSQLKNK